MSAGDRRSGARRSGAMRWLMAAALCAGALGCGDRDPATPAGARAAAFVPFDTAIGRAIGFLSDPASLYSHSGFYFVEFLHRRFGIAAFEDVSDRYRTFRSHSPIRLRGIDPFERLIAPRTRLQQVELALASHPVDRLSIEALYSDNIFHFRLPPGNESR